MNFNKRFKHDAKQSLENKCLFVLIDGYRIMKNKGNYQRDWEEEDITEQLIYFMNQSNYAIKWKIDISAEKRLYTHKTAFQNKTAKKTPRIDMRLMSWQSTTKEEYLVEAKNLSETNWNKNDGSKVNASYQLNRFINSGIEHFLSNYYPPNSCLCGYILQGSTENIIEKLNKILEKKSLQRLKLADSVFDHKLIYRFSNPNLFLKNIFLELNEQKQPELT